MSYDIGPVIGIEGEAAFRRSIRDVNASLKAMTAEMKAVESAYAAGDQSEEKLRKQNELLNRQIEAQRNKLAELSAMLQRSTERYGETDERTQRWRRAVNDATADLNRLDRGLAENVIALNAVVEANSEFAQAQRRAEEAAERLREEQARLASRVDETSGKLQKSSEALGAVNRAAALSAAALGVLGIAAGKLGMGFEAGMSKVQAISRASADEMTALTDKAKELGAKTKFSASESADAFQFMSQAGWNAQAMLDGIEGVMDLAAASGEDLALTSSIVTNSLTAFGMKASESAHFADVLAMAANASNTGVAEMGETFKYAAPVAGALGYSIEDVSVAIGLMANAGIKGETAGTALRGALTNLAKPSDEVAMYMKRLGISLTDAKGQVLPFNKLTDNLRKSFAGLTDAQKAEYAAGIAGKEAMSGLLAVVNASDSDYQSLRKSINSANGAAKEAAGIMQNNLAGSFEELGGSLESVGLAAYEKFEAPLRNAVNGATGSMGELAASLESGKLDDNIKGITAAATGAVVGLAALNATLAVKDLMNFATAAKAGGAAMEAYTAATKAGALAQGALNLAQVVSPMGWIAIAAGAAATAFIAYKAMTHESTSETAILSEKINALNKELEAQTSAQNELVETRSNSLGDVNTEINQVSNYISELAGLTDANGKVIDGYKERAAFLSEQINTLIPGAVSASNDEAGAYYKITDSIEQMLFAKKKEMLLAAWEVEYQDALKNRAAALDKVREAAEKQAVAEDAVNKLRQESMAATGRDQMSLDIKIAEAEKLLQKSVDTTNEAKASLDGYSTTINGFNTAQAAQNMGQLNGAIAGFSSTLVKATGDNRVELEKSVVDAKTNLDILVGETGKAWANMTEVERQEAKNQVAEQRALLDQQATEARRGGVQLPENFGQGVTEGSPLFSAAMSGMFNDGKKTVQAAGVALVDVGYGYTLLFNQGIGSGTEDVKAAGAVMAVAAENGAESKPNKPGEIGANFAKGFIGGLSSKEILDLTWGAGWKLGKTAATATAKAGEVNSPSRVMKRIGGFFAEGFGLGITDGITFARRASVKLADAIISEVSDLNKELADMEAKEQKEQAVKELADHQKAIKEKYEELGKAESKEKQKILDEIAKLQGDWNDKQVKAEKDAAKLALKEKIATLEEFKKEYDSALSELERKQQSMAEKLSGYSKLFETVKPEVGEEYLKLGDLQKDIDKITAYGDALEGLKDRGISDSLLSEITSMSVDDALSYADLLLKKTPEQYDEYMKKWGELQTKSADVAKKFYQDEFKQLQTEFVDKIPTELGKLKTEMQGIGKNSAIGLADGFWSQKAHIVSTFKGVLESALAEAKQAMEIHSPSRRWAEVGMYMAEGLGVGFSDRMQSVAKQISNSIPVPSAETNSVAKIVEGGVNGLASLVQGAGYQGTAPIVLQVNLDSREIAKATYDPLQDEYRLRGK